MSKVVHISDGTSVIAHMHWSVYLGAKRDRNIIRKTGQMVSGLRYVIDGDDDGRQIGFETPDVMSVTNKKTKRQVSFALLCREFLLEVSEGESAATQNGIFVMQVEGDTDKRAICAIRNGRVVQDSVETRARAFSLAEERHQEMAGYCQVIAEHDELPITLTREVLWEELMSCVDKNILLTTVPMSPMVPLALLALVAALGCGTAYFFMVHQPNVEASNARKRAEADKTPEYMKALKAASLNAGWERSSIKRFIDRMKDRPYFTAGWSLVEVTCDQKRCLETWERQGGDLAQLINANKGATLVADTKLNKDSAVMEWVIQSEPGMVELDGLPAAGFESQVLFKPVVNKLDNAGVRMQLGKEEVWPKYPLKGVKKDVLVTAQKVELTSKYPLSVEALDMTPRNVVYNGFTLKTANPKEFLITVEGNAYVR